MSLLAALGSSPRRVQCSGATRLERGESVPSFCLLPAGAGEVGWYEGKEWDPPGKPPLQVRVVSLSGQFTTVIAAPLLPFGGVWLLAHTCLLSPFGALQVWRATLLVGSLREEENSWCFCNPPAPQRFAPSSVYQHSLGCSLWLD